VSEITRAYIHDLVERVVMTFIQAFAAVVLAGSWLGLGGAGGIGLWKKASLAGVAAVIALLKGLLVKALGVGDPATAGLVTIPKPAQRAPDGELPCP